VMMMMMVVAKLSLSIPYCSKAMTCREAVRMTNCTIKMRYRRGIDADINIKGIRGVGTNREP
jgi:hypothetical protein